MGKKVKQLQQRVKELQRQMSAQYTVTREHADRLRKLERAAGDPPTLTERLEEAEMALYGDTDQGDQR
jgi:hypothetical protein